MTFQKIFKVGFNKHNCPKINISIHKGKKILSEKCLFIAISFYGWRFGI